MTIGILLLAVAELATVELFVRTGVTHRFALLADTGTRSVRILRRQASDRWKERAIGRLWLQMMQHTAMLAAVTLLALLPIAALYLGDRLLGLQSFRAMDFGRFHLALIGGPIGYAILRGRMMRGR